jgi:hypothetical protein
MEAATSVTASVSEIGSFFIVKELENGEMKAENARKTRLWVTKVMVFRNQLRFRVKLMNCWHQEATITPRLNKLPDRKWRG